jgi:hypothetical protein
MKRLLVSLAAVGLLVGLAAGPVAAAGVQRTQLTTTPYTIVVEGTYTHIFAVTTSCDGTFSGTGTVGSINETINSWTVASGMVSFTATYDGTTYSWSGSFLVGGGSFTGTDTTGQSFPATATPGTPTTTAWANHGAYVSAMGGGADAAHSCVGMPIKP